MELHMIGIDLGKNGEVVVRCASRSRDSLPLPPHCLSHTRRRPCQGTSG
jgi:hypothetical protein